MHENLAVDFVTQNMGSHNFTKEAAQARQAEREKARKKHEARAAHALRVFYAETT